MNKIEKIDFILQDDEYEATIFRFRPRKSSCHSYGKKLPTCECIRIEAICKAVEAIEKQIPKKPLHMHKNY